MMLSFKTLLALLSVALVQAVPTPAPQPAGESVGDIAELLTRQNPRAAVYSACSVPNTVALTFDDGPYWWTQQVADTLSNAGARGTFFVNGNNWACIYDGEISRQLKYAYDRGHQIASHTWAHQNLATLNWDQIHHQMWLSEQAIERITGAVPAFMRPPYGSYNNLVLEASYIRGQKVVLWDLELILGTSSSGDSVGVDVNGQRGRFNDLANRRPSTALTLQHEVHQSTVDNVLPYAIQRLQQAGYQLVTVAECLGQAPYQRVGAPKPRDGSWVC
ncbi:chitin deacetylase [Coprinopsis sp. MPI-PUGE-AT-0042]|nr:chitin deacetylase [Coprinopsis sp. MPI-PUGE-AT-0042]